MKQTEARNGRKKTYKGKRRENESSAGYVAKLEYPEAEDIVGIATEPGVNNGGRSEDAIYFDARGWNDEMAGKARELQEKLGILRKPQQIKEYVQEYPDVPIADSTMKTMKNPRNKPCPCGSGKKYKHCCLNKPR